MTTSERTISTRKLAQHVSQNPEARVAVICERVQHVGLAAFALSCSVEQLEVESCYYFSSIRKLTTKAGATVHFFTNSDKDMQRLRAYTFDTVVFDSPDAAAPASVMQQLRHRLRLDGGLGMVLRVR